MSETDTVTHREQLIELLYRLRPDDIVKYEGSGQGKKGPVAVRVSEISIREGNYCVLAEGKEDGKYVLFPDERPGAQKFDPPEACYIHKGHRDPPSEMKLATHGTIQWIRLIIDDELRNEFRD